MGIHELANTEKCSDELDCAEKETEFHFNIKLQNILSQVRTGAVSEKYCEQCGDEIPEGRRVAYPGVTQCFHCKSIEERVGKHRGKDYGIF
ncbi:TraR/DksA C4-type zinc finger protein [Yersinia aldovae]|uniref:TraR/DksA C4-type zinc finger protein n=1 Tax=Yersinia aldovae TaxID=29483 RepID=UPI0011A3EB79|nr:TraR/DksA C4-type zinc finger protein [Yersinia aldovae]